MNDVDEACVVKIDNSGNVYVTGSSTGNGSGFDYLTIKYNDSGQELWTARFNGTSNANDNPSGLAVDASGNVFVTGQSSGLSSSNDFLTIKYNSIGQVVWSARYNSSSNNNDGATGIAVSNAGNVYVTGFSYATTTLNDYTTLMFNSAGQLRWASRYNSPASGSDEAKAIVVDANGNAYVTGGSSMGGTHVDYATVKYNIYGQQLWALRFNGVGDDYDAATAITLDNSSNLYVTGTSMGSTSSDFATMRYAVTTGIEPVSGVIPKSFMLYNNYPNPFNPETKIKFDIPKTAFTKLTVYDITGRTVGTLINQDLSPGSYVYDFNAAQLSSGVYFFKIQAGDFNDTKKMMLVK
jgi:hypothetical protein